MGAMANDSELFFDYGDRYLGALDEGHPVKVADVSAYAAPPNGGFRRETMRAGRLVGAAGQSQGLQAQLRRHGDCNVPKGCAKDPTLG